MDKFNLPAIKQCNNSLFTILGADKIYYYIVYKDV
ncbi:hypothetical protein TcasGA2_TC031920 [Tribolium castaneum]|uniref:Uncharacterized protein n=1 Tax=Tribolium castaneum TaxID=7070 RepID=A0A139W9Q1_TRICA|nr:hypothetical protein TcasGA2_TC031920 [Tribolium castaneum]